MGRPKGLLEYRGVPFLRAVAAALLTGGVEELVAVLNPEVPGLPEVLPADTRVRWVAAPLAPPPPLPPLPPPGGPPPPPRRPGPPPPPPSWTTRPPAPSRSPR